jgi:hypothetical protein
MNELWKPVIGFSKTHIVSNFGRVASTPRSYAGITPKGDKSIRYMHGGILKMQRSNSGYFRVALAFNGVIKYRSVHRLVAMSFCTNPHNFKQVNHIDGNKTNNISTNLEWCSASHNQLHAIAKGLVKHPLGSVRAFAKLSDDDVRQIREQISAGIVQRQIAKNYGVCPSKITSIKQGKAWKHIV